MNNDIPSWDATADPSTVIPDVPQWEEPQSQAVATATPPSWDDTTDTTPKWEDTAVPGTPQSDTPETTKALTGIQQFAKAEAELEEKYSPDWLKNFTTAADEMVQAVPGMLKQIPEMAYQGAKFASGSLPQQKEVAAKLLSEAIPQGKQLAADLQSPPGSHEWWRGMLQAGTMAAPILEFLPKGFLRSVPKPEVPIEKPPVQPPPIPPEYAERRFQMVPEAAPEIAPAGTIEETLAQVGAQEPRVSPETGMQIFPERDVGVQEPIQTQTARVGGETNAVQPSNAQVEGGAATLGVETRPSGEQPSAGSGDYAVGETQGEGARGNIPGEEPVPAGQTVAPAAQEANAPVEDHLTVSEAQQIGELQGMLQRGEIDPAGYAEEARKVLERRQPTSIEANIGQAKPPVQGQPPPPPGIRNISIEEAIKRGELPPEAQVTGEGWNAAKAKAFGRAKLAQDPQAAFKIARRLERTGAMEPGDPAVLHAYHDQLNTIARDARMKADAAPGNAALEAAAKQAEGAQVDFLKDVAPLAKGEAQKMLVGFQGAYPPDLETFAGIRKEIVENQGKELSRSQRANSYLRADRAQGVAKKVVKQADRLQKVIDRDLPKRSIPTRDQMKASASEFIKKAAPCRV